MSSDLMDWLLNSNEPWTRYRTLVDLLDRPEDDLAVQSARDEMLAHPQIQTLITAAAAWPGYALKRHNDAQHPLYALSALADFGLRAGDPGLAAGLEKVLARQSPAGAFLTQLQLYRQFGGLEGQHWVWLACDAPTLLYVLLAMGLGHDERVPRATHHLVSLAQENGWRCTAAPELGKFKGPGRRDDPCPIANVYALKALSQAPEWLDSPATRRGADMLLWHWEHQAERKLYLFGIGADFRKLKYPFVWYDILHVVDVLSRLSFVHADPRFRAMVDTITAQADETGRYAAGSMYRAWQGWSFADKKRPSPWLTFLVLRILKRLPGGQP
ncbi:MAG: hypothetical protein AB1801_22365 [Chloroflexota bacterium]